jgi:hypothetical protein
MTHFTNTNNPIDFPNMKLKEKPSAAYITAARQGAANEALRRAHEQNLRNEERRVLIADAHDIGVGIVHIFCQYSNKGGLTVAFKKCSPHVSGRMVEVAVATCSPEDTFSKKIGTHLALNSWFNGETIKLPLLGGYPDEDINGAVKQAFKALYNA